MEVILLQAITDAQLIVSGVTCMVICVFAIILILVNMRNKHRKDALKHREINQELGLEKTHKKALIDTVNILEDTVNVYEETSRGNSY